MDYEAFKAAWTHALQKSGLSLMGLHPKEELDIHSLDRKYEIHVEPLGGQDAPPFHVTATLSWHWHALNTARGVLREEDLLTEMLGSDAAIDQVSEKRYLDVHIRLRAAAPFDTPLPLPLPSAWQKWARENGQRLDEIEPLVPVETLRQSRLGTTEVLAWQMSPRITAVCSESGELRLETVQITAAQLIELPRLLDAPDDSDGPDEGPEKQLTDLFERLRASLTAWMQALDHLRPGRR
jgi:hypothetical protein